VSYSYAPLASKTVAIIAKYGKQVTLEITPLTAADSAKPWRGPGAAAVTTKTPMGVTSSFEKKEVDGERIKETDIKLLVAAGDAQMSGVSIDRVTRAQVGGVWYGASDVSQIEPGDTKMLYTLRLRG
jgi:hypothetical protein